MTEITEVAEELESQGFSVVAKTDLGAINVFDPVDTDLMWETAHEASGGATDVVMLCPGKFQIQF